MLGKGVWFAVLVLAPGVYGCAAVGPRQDVGALNSGRSEATSSIQVAPQDRETNPPPGFVDFCQTYANQCNEAQDASARVSLTDDALQTLRLVNIGINRSIRPEDDRRHYGLDEVWAIPLDNYGDCEDYVLVKRKALITFGMPASALRITLVFTQGLVRHAVLTVVTDKGNYVLDNLSDEIVSWDHAPYTWIKWQDPRSRSGWASLDQNEVRLAGINQQQVRIGAARN